MSAHRYTRREVQALISQTIDTYALRVSHGEQAKTMTMGLMNALLDKIEEDLRTWVRCTRCQSKAHYQIGDEQPTACTRCGSALPKPRNVTAIGAR